MSSKENVVRQAFSEIRQRVGLEAEIVALPLGRHKLADVSRLRITSELATNALFVLSG